MSGLRPSSRERIVAAALEHAASQGDADVSLAAYAKAAGVTKQGLIYHFPSKPALRAATLDAVFYRWETAMVETLGKPLRDVTTGQRIRAYAAVAARGDVVAGERSLFAQLTLTGEGNDDYARWTERWFSPDPTMPSVARGRALTAWLAANSLWSALSTGKRALSEDEVTAVLETISELTTPDA